MAEGPFCAALQGGPQWLVSLVTHAWWSVSALMNRVKAWKRKGKWGEGLPVGDSVTCQWIQAMTPFCLSLKRICIFNGFGSPWLSLVEWRLLQTISFPLGWLRFWHYQTVENLTNSKKGQKAEFPTVLQRTSDLVKLGRWKWRGPTNHHLSFDDVLKIYSCFGFLHVAACVFQLLGTTDIDVNVNSLIIACPWALFT